jgi:hypothetical protein
MYEDAGAGAALENLVSCEQRLSLSRRARL